MGVLLNIQGKYAHLRTKTVDISGHLPIFSVSVGNILFGIFQKGAFSPEGGLYPTMVLDIFFFVLILMGLLSVAMARRRIRQLQRQASNEHETE